MVRLDDERLRKTFPLSSPEHTLYEREVCARRRLFSCPHSVRDDVIMFDEFWLILPVIYACLKG